MTSVLVNDICTYASVDNVKCIVMVPGIATRSVADWCSWHIIHKGRLHETRKKSTHPCPSPLSALVIVTCPPLPHLWTSRTTGQNGSSVRKIDWWPGVLWRLRLLMHIPAYKFKYFVSFSIKLGGQLIFDSADLLSVVAIISCQTIRHEDQSRLCSVFDTCI